MYPNLLGQKALHKLTEDDMANLLGISRTAYQKKAKTGRFTPQECRKFCRYFNKTFEYLFAEEGDDFLS